MIDTSMSAHGFISQMIHSIGQIVGLMNELKDIYKPNGIVQVSLRSHTRLTAWPMHWLALTNDDMPKKYIIMTTKQQRVI